MVWKSNAKVIIWDEYVRAESAGQVVASTWGEFLRWAAGQSAQCVMPADAAAPAGDALAPIAAALGCAADSAAILDAIGRLRAASEPAAPEPASASEPVTVKAVARTAAKPAKAQKPAKPTDVAATWRELARYASTDQTRPNVCCIHVSRRHDGWLASATDGHRLLRRFLPAAAVRGDADAFLIPADAIKRMDDGALRDIEANHGQMPTIAGVKVGIHGITPDRFPDVSRLTPDKPVWLPWNTVLRSAGKRIAIAAEQSALASAAAAGWGDAARLEWERICAASGGKAWSARLKAHLLDKHGEPTVSLGVGNDGAPIVYGSAMAWRIADKAVKREDLPQGRSGGMYVEWDDVAFACADGECLQVPEVPDDLTLRMNPNYLADVPADFDGVSFAPDGGRVVQFRSSRSEFDLVLIASMGKPKVKPAATK